MSAWFRRACDRATNLGLSMAELSRRVHGRLDRRDMVNLSIALEAQIQKQDAELAMRSTKLFGGRAA